MARLAVARSLATHLLGDPKKLLLDIQQLEEPTRTFEGSYDYLPAFFDAAAGSVILFLQPENLSKLASVLVEIEINFFGNRLELELALIHFWGERFDIASGGNTAHVADHRLRFG